MNQVTSVQGRYRLDRRIAAGGMGVVYAATDLRLDRPVAVKLPNEGLADDGTFVHRFQREAHAVAALSHPNIATVYDYGEENGRPFIVMELIDGEDLARVLAQKGRLVPADAAWIAIQVCAALACAHSRGIVHRDVKPANIIVCRESDRIKVTDFGIARAAGDQTLTGTGAVFGSADYISPEQAGGERATPRSDIYSLGIVLYEMLTGLRPFPGDSAMASLMQRMNEDVPLPSKVQPQISPEFDEVVRRATARDPRERFQHANEMVDALRGTLDRTTPLWERSGALTIAAPPQPEGAEVTARYTGQPSGGLARLPARAKAAARAGLAGAGSQPTLVIGAVLALLVVLMLLLGPWSETSPQDRAGLRQQQTDPAIDARDRLSDELDDLEEAVRP